MANILTVTALNRYVRSQLESDPALLDIAIKGEISNFNSHFKTGHCYFSLKDDNSSVKAVMFRTAAQRLAFTPENGMSVVARCRVSLYERDGAFQLYVEDLFPDGVGAAQMAFEQLKARLQKEGLFEEDLKKQLPAYPRRVGVVTSKTGAALQDILKVAARRCPLANFVLTPVTVQGQAAAPEIAGAIEMLDKSGLVDVIIVARGGGSAEDLWVFNAEAIARAVFECKTPVVSAIGHEIDFTILDFVADLRAPTPSAAAEMVLPDLLAQQNYRMSLYNQIKNNMQQRLNSCYNRVGKSARHPAFLKIARLPAENQIVLEKLEKQLRFLMKQRIERAERRLAASAGLAESLNPYGVLARGYSISKKDDTVLRSVQQVQPGEKITILVTDGKIGCTVNSTSASQVTGE